MRIDKKKLKKLIISAQQRKKEKEYWIEKLGGEWKKSIIPYDYPRHFSREWCLKSSEFKFAERITAQLLKMSSGSEYALNVIFHAALVVLLSRYNNSQDIIVGMPIYKQEHTGDYINAVLALRNRLTERMTFKDLLLQVKQNVMEAFENCNYPLQLLVEHLNIPYGQDSDFPLFDVALLIENIQEKELLHTMECSMVFSFSRDRQSLQGVVEYNTSRYCSDSVGRIISHFSMVLQELLFNVDQSVNGFDILSSREKHRILYEFNDTEAYYPKDKTVHELFEEQVDKTSDQIAVVSRHEEHEGHEKGNYQIAITYKELNHHSNLFACTLREKGVMSDTILAISLGRSLEMIIGILGILKSGGAYLPIDPDYPEERIGYMLADSNAKILITKSEIRNPKFDTNPNDQKINVIVLDFEHLDFNFLIGHSRPLSGGLSGFEYRASGFNSSSLAYIIYTSGTTGQPKGSLIEHRNVVRLVLSDKFQFDFSDCDVWTLFHSFCFDFSVWEMYGALLYGGKLIIVPKVVAMDTAEFLGLLNRENVTVLNQTPSAFYNLIDEVLNPHRQRKNLYMKYVIFGGEALNPLKLKDWLGKYPQTRFINMFGITETTVHVTYKEITEKDIELNVSNIGKPIPTLSAYILDRYLRPVPLGVTGEICVGGDGVGRGYLNRVELTKEKFVESPYNPGGRLYRSGDTGRFLENGDMEYSGRIDHQVKIRGFRIELGEIENRLLKYDGIKDAVVLAEETPDEKYLCAYIVADKGFTLTELRTHLSGKLPDYMIPSYFVRIEKVPLTPNGKVDRRAFPKPELKVGENYIAPKNEIETKLVELWAEILGRDKLHKPQLQTSIGIHDNFFELGGHSLNATILVSKIHKLYDVIVPLTEIFKTPRIKELAKYIKEKSKEFHISIEPAEEKEYYELSPAQKRLYILQQLVTDNTSYNMPLVMPLAESVEKEKLESVFKKLIERHESLRTSFITVNEEPFQRIHREVDFPIGFYEIKEEAEVVPLISGFTKPFDLGLAPLLRVNLIVVGSSRWVLFIDMHHIVTDGTSQGILEKEFLGLQAEEELHPLRLQYKDYSEWYNKALRQEAIKQQESYWLKEFPDELPVLDLPTDYPRPSIQSVEGNVVSFSFTVRETNVLKAIAKENEATPYMALLAIFNILLAKLSRQEAIIIGTAIAARRHADLLNVIGMLVNTLAMRNYPSGDKAFKEFLREVQVRTLDAYENQEYPFEVLVDKIKVNRDVGRNPVFDIMFNLLNQEDYKVEVPGQNDQVPYLHKKGTSKFDMNLTAVEIGERLFFTLEYSTHLFKPVRIERIIGYYKNILEVLSRDTGLKIAEIEIMGKEEQEAVLKLSRGMADDYEGMTTVHRLFEEQAARTPDNIAVIGQTVRTKHLRFLENKNASPAPIIQLSYRELNEMSNQSAYRLREKGVGSDSAVGLMVERSVEMIIGVLGIMKAGGAYLPIDSELPGERKRYMIEDGEVRCLVVSDDTEDIGDEIINRLEVIDLRQENIYRRDNSNLEYIGNGSDLVYVIYTSGSTGKPKGVMVEHRNLLNLLKFQFKYTNIDCSRILQFSTISFDASFHEIFSVFLSGGQLYLVNKEIRTNIPELFRLIEMNVITTVFLPISFLRVIFKEEEYIKRLPRSIRHIQTAGDQVVISNNFRKYLRERKVYLHNHYGPSETHVVTTLTIYPEGDITELPSIGKPVINTGIYIVDKWGHFLPQGVAGEIWIGGVQVGRGYLNRPELTAEKFIIIHHHSSFTIHHPILYRTGDLARLLSDGNIEFLGRIDHQIKIRGFRVELGEIESRLLNYPGIKEVVALVREEGSGDKYICAYAVSDREYEIAGLREFLSKKLPDYMIPSYFVRLEKIPLTHNGKVNRKALPKPEINVGESYTGPRNEIEKKLVELWAEILSRDGLHGSQLQTSIGIDDNFFQLGGHSLKATILASRVHKELNVNFPLAELFKTPTIRGLSEYIRGRGEEIYESIMPAEEKEYYVLSFAQQRMYILQQIDLNNTAYNMPGIILLSEEVDTEKLEESFKKLIKRHDSLRTSFHMIGDQPVQKVHEEVDFKIEKYKESDVHRFVRAFDLSCMPLLRVGELKTMEGRNYLVVDMHHIISDGISGQVLREDFMALYEGKELLPLRIQYKDFAQWQKSPKEVERLHRQMLYWLKEFEGEIPLLETPLDYPRPLSQSFEGKSIDFEISTEETRSLNEMALQGGATLFMVLVAAVNILLSKLSGQEEIIIGTPIAGRRHPDLEKIIGMFINTLVLKNYPIGDRTFNEFLEEVKERVLLVFENQEFPFEGLVDKLSLKRDVGHNPLFDVMFAMQNMNTVSTDPGDGTPSETGPSVQPAFPKEYENIIQAAKFDLTFTAVERGQKTFFSIQYCTKLFKKVTIERFIIYFKKIVSIAIKEPGIKITDIEIISEEEKKRILFDFNDTAAEYLQDKTIDELFEEQVEKSPDRIAVIGSTIETLRATSIQITYRQLNNQSNRLALQLQEKGIPPDSIVGIMVERSVEMIIGILGILKSGGVYLPIDPDLPEERIDYMLKDSGAKLLVNEKFFGGSVPAGAVFQKNSPGDNKLAYLIYTSGSTGRPKGVAVEHSSAINILTAMHREYPLKVMNTYLLKTSYMFDVSVTELFGWFMEGGKLAILEKGGEKDPTVILNSVERQFVTHINFVPAMFKVFVDELEVSPRNIRKLSGLKYIFLAGEILLPGLVNKFKQLNNAIALENIYGPTEATVYSSRYSLASGEFQGNIPIGKPMQNVVLFILGSDGNMKPIGVPGELYIGGAGLARGYLNHPELTAEKFEQDLWDYQDDQDEKKKENYQKFFRGSRGAILQKSPPSRRRLYKTGDLARWVNDGNIEFLGRIDHQVKIRGFRIELGEIENRLRGYADIREAIVISKEEDEHRDNYLHAFIVSESEISVSELREYLSKYLPDYMVPSYFSKIEKMPITPSGKIDRKSFHSFNAFLQPGAEFAEPADEIEEKIADIWKAILKLDKVGIYDNFFALGGNSLQIVALNNRLKKIFQKDIPVVKMFTYPTIHSLTNYLKQEEANNTISDKEAREFASIMEGTMQMLIGEENGDEYTS
ncbi:MAG: hypothetical protein QG657_5568 [Acidobacteriota bacterium]|nr:hypothetical protein [Acidobacteriota bacterium]